MKQSSMVCSFGTTTSHWILAISLAFSLVVASTMLQAQTSAAAQDPTGKTPRVVLPLIVGFFNGQVVDYLLTEASDQSVAQALDVNYSPILANAITGGAVDDIYQVTNFNQGRVLASAPVTAGPGNTNPSYTPDWRLNLVTWNTIPHLLTSEQQNIGRGTAGLTLGCEDGNCRELSRHLHARGRPLPRRPHYWP